MLIEDCGIGVAGIIEGAKDGKGRGRQVIAGMFSFLHFLPLFSSSFD